MQSVDSWVGGLFQQSLFFMVISGHQYENVTDHSVRLYSGYCELWKYRLQIFIWTFSSFSTEAMVPFLTQRQRRCFSVPWHLQNQQLIFAHSYKEPNIAAAIAFDQEEVLEILSLALAHTKIKCVSFVSLTDSSFIGMSTHANTPHIYITKRDNKSSPDDDA